MADWHALVRERLNLAEFSQAQREEIVAELADHLADLCREYRAQGLSESDAVARAVHEVTDWHALSKTIQRAKGSGGSMNDRTKQIWAPGLLSLFASLAWIILLQMIDSRLHINSKYFGTSAIPNAVWLLSLPCIGAASAYLSKRAGGSRSVLIGTALSYSIVMSLVWLLILAVVVARRQPFDTIGFRYGFLHAVVFPGIALLLGTLPFLRPNKLSA